MGWYIIIGTIPISIVGVILHSPIETGARNLELIGSTLVVFGVVMWAADRTARRTRDLSSLNRTDGVFIGVAQALALVPGVSRSGATISAGLVRDLDRESAARYSFLLSIPAVVLSGLFELRKIGEPGGAGAVPTAIATLLAFVVGYLSIAFLLRYLARHTLGLFVVYRIVLGAIVLALAVNGTIS
jgi:undecaprenyl-diphosphatase